MVRLWKVRRTGWLVVAAVLLAVRPDAAAPGTPGVSLLFSKAFGVPSIPLNGSTSLSFTITNSLFVTGGIAFTDTLPAGLVVATPNGLAGSCGGGTITAVAGSGTVSLSAGVSSPIGSCTFSINVTGTSAGNKTNTTSTLTNTSGLSPTAGATASITVVAPPVIIKAFGTASIVVGGSTSLTFTIQNNNASPLSGVGFTDTLPAGLVVATPNGLGGSCGGGVISATAGSSTVSLAGATVPASSSCVFLVNVTGTAGGLQSNTTGQVTSTEGGTGGTASASVTVTAPVPLLAPAGLAGLALLLLAGTTLLLMRRRTT